MTTGLTPLAGHNCAMRSIRRRQLHNKRVGPQRAPPISVNSWHKWPQVRIPDAGSHQSRIHLAARGRLLYLI
jgi:hypothetical protein